MIAKETEASEAQKGYQEICNCIGRPCYPTAILTQGDVCYITVVGESHYAEENILFQME